MTRLPVSAFCSLLVVLLFFFGLSPSDAAVVYTQHFNHPNTASGANLNLSSTSFGWSAYATTTATAVTAGASGKYSVLVNPLNPTPELAPGGYLYTRSDASATAVTFALVSELLAAPISLNDGPLSATLRGNISHAGIDVRVMIEVGGQWYVSSDNLNLAVGSQYKFVAQDEPSVAQNSKEFTLSFQASQWQSLTLIPGSSMSVGDVASADLTGTITRVGFYSFQPAVNELSMARYDALILTQVPEPSKLLLFCSGLIVLALKRRR